MAPTTFFASAALLALAASSAVASHHPQQRRRSLGGQQSVHAVHAARRAEQRAPARHDYIRSNSTLASRPLARRGGQSAEATFYHPATEGGAQSSCGEWMNDYTMGVALSQPGWDYFQGKGVSNNDLCYKGITIHGPFGEQKAKIMDTCPPDSSTNTCGNICDIDLTYGLFGKLEEYAAGIFSVSWSFDDGTPSPCGSGSGSSASQSSSSSPSPTFKSNAAKSSPSSSSSSPAPSSSSSGSSNGGMSTTLQWWDDIDNQWCPGINTPSGTVTAAIGPTSQYSNENLQDACGKWITIHADGKSTQAQVVEWVPGSEQNLLAVGTAYSDIIGSSTGSVTWSFN